MRWVKSCLCFLRVEVALQWVRCSKVLLVLYLKARGKSMNLNSREKVEQMIISLDSKSSWLKVVIQSMFLIVAGSLLFAVLALTACASSHAPSGLKQNSYRSRTQQEKEGLSGYSDSSRIHQPKSRSLSLADTLPLWGKHPFVRFSDFTLARPQEDE